MESLTEPAPRGAGFTVAILASSNHHDLEVLGKPDADLDGVVGAFDVDEEEVVWINGWPFVFEAVCY